MVWTLLPFGLVVVLVAAMLLSANALAARPACSSGKKLPGEDAGADGLAGGEGFSQADQPETL